MNDVFEAAKAFDAKTREWRRYLHSRPELGMDTENTAAFVEKVLREIGVTELRRCGKTGVLALIRGRGEGRCAGLRADMDALPVDERSDLPFKSMNAGRAHACGHDVHTACLLGAAKVLQDRKDGFTGTVKLIFQPGEEIGEGALAMIADGALEDPARREPKMDAVFALHVWSDIPAGTVGIRRGPVMAGAQAIRITIKGKQGHAAHPHRCVDPILIAGHTLCALQSIVSREMPPLDAEVLSIGKISGGTAGNIIPETVVLEGTVRTLSKDANRRVLDSAKRIAEGTAAALRGSATFEAMPGLLPVTNDDALFDAMQPLFVNLFGAERVRTLPEPSMGGEDFSYFLDHVPGVHFRLGVGREGAENYPLHSPDFFADDSGLSLGVAALAALALETLKS
ncbi:MAG: amidohydrolase [Synergistaceae bacterium]|nr:amidohydrolase [Synergistaceae bacterium]